MKTPCCFIVAVAFSFAWQGPARGQPAGLKRRYDHVVVPGDRLRHLRLERIDELRLLAFRDDFEVIPYQIDERLPNGEYAFDKGANPRADEDKGRLDRNDELVFMARDAGGRAPAHRRSALRLSALGLIEIAIEDPVDRGRAWVYLARFRSPPPRSTVDYVSISYEKKILEYRGAGFLISNASVPDNALRNTRLQFFDAQGKPSLNLLDTTKMRGELYYFRIPVRRDETEIRASVGAYIDGPIRAIVRNDIEAYVVWGFWIRTSSSILYMYESGTVSPTSFDFPINIDESPSSTMRVSTDLSSRARGWSFYNSHNKTPCSLGDRQAASRIDSSYPDWNALHGPEGGFVHRLLFDDVAIVRRPKSQLFYSDDSSKPDAPESEPGSSGNSGFVVDFSGVQKGVYKATFYAYYKPGFRFGDEREFLRIVDRPLRIKTAPVKQDGSVIQKR